MKRNTKPRPPRKPKPAKAAQAGAASVELPETVSTKTLLVLFGTSDRWLRDLAGKGFLPHPKVGRWATVETIQGWIKYQKQKTGGSDTLADAKLKRAVAQARSAEVQADLDEGKAVLVDDARLAFAQAAAKTKTRLLAVPPSVAPKLVGLDVTEMTARIDAEVKDALGELDRVRIGKPCPKQSN